MYVPASDQRKVAKTTTLSVDSLVFDIEDGVALNQKVNEMIVAVIYLELHVRTQRKN